MKSRFIQNAFTSGVLTSLFKGRIDLQQYHNGLEQGDDCVVIPHGGIKRRPGTQYIGTAIPKLTRNSVLPTMPNGGAAANINDGSDATTATTTVNISTVDPYVVAKTDLGSATYIEVVDVRGLFLTTNTSDEFRVQWSDDDVTYFNAATVPLVGTAAQDFRLYVGRTKRYWRLARIGSTDLGTDKATLAEFNLWEKSGTLSEVKLKDFSVSSDRQYLLAISDENCRIYNKATQAHVADVKTPYLSSECLDVRDAQTEQVMLMFHENHPTQRLINLGTDTDWTLDDAPFTNVPQYDFNDSLSPTPTSDVQVMTFTGFVAGDTFQIDIEGVLSKNITFAGDATAAERSASEENIRKNIQDMPVVGDTGVSVSRTGALAYTITISGESTKAFKLFSGFHTEGTGAKTIAFTHSVTGVPRKEDVWSATRGYPKTGCFYAGRLILGGTRDKRQSLFASKAGLYFNFELDEGDPNDAIFITISTRTFTDIVDVYPGRVLQIFTTGGELVDKSEKFTPAEVGVALQTSYGSRNLETKEIDGATLFADRNGKSIKAFVFSDVEQAYVAQDISVLAPALINKPVDIGVLGGTSSDNANWVFIVNNDGQGAILNTLRSQDINAFTKWTTTGFLTNVAVVDDELYMVNKRTVGGVESYFIERWNFDHLLDNSLIQTNVAPLTTLSNLDHLEGETVSVVADGSVLPDRVVSGGQITLTEAESAHTQIEVGIKFVPTIKPLPVVSNPGSGSNQMRLKKVIRMNLMVENTGGAYIDGDPIPVRSFGAAGDSPLDSPPASYTGIIDDVFPNYGWSRLQAPVISFPDPTPFTILSIEYEVESS